MKTPKFLLVITPVVILISVFVIPHALPDQSLSVQIIGYKMYTCNNNSNPCMGSNPILFSNGATVFHEGDRFLLVISVNNPNPFPITFDSVSTTFDSNAISYQYWTCSGESEKISVKASESNEITIPTNCEVFVANSIGKTNATVSFQYKVNGIQYATNASESLGVLPET